MSLRNRWLGKLGHNHATEHYPGSISSPSLMHVLDWMPLQEITLGVKDQTKKVCMKERKV